MEKIRERMDIARDVAVEKFEVARNLCTELYDRKAVKRSFEVGYLVWQWLPGLTTCWKMLGLVHSR